MTAPQPRGVPLAKVRLLGHSMAPFILPGSTLHVEPVGMNEIELGDVVCYIGQNAQVIAHRVVGKTQALGGAIMARGDARDFVDEVPRGAVISVVCGVEHPLLSYETRGAAGRILARIALGRGGTSRLIKTVLVRLWGRSVHILGLIQKVHKRT